MDINGYNSQIILEYIGEGLLYADTEGKILFINKAAENLTGWSRDECLGRKIEYVFRIKNKLSDIYYDDYCYNVMKSGEEKGLLKDTVLVKKDLSIFYISAKISPVKNEENVVCGMVIVFRDISRLKSIEDKLSFEEKKFKTIYENAPVGMLVVDEKLTIKDINKSMLRIIEKEIDECVGRRFGDGIGCVNSFIGNSCGKSDKCFECLTSKILTDFFKNRMEYIEFEVETEILIKGNRVLKWFKICVTNADIVGANDCLLVIDDITEKKLMEDTIIRSRDYYISLFENFPALIWRTGVDAKCDYLNKNWLNFTGRSIEQDIGTGWIEVVHPDDVKRVKDVSRDAFIKREPIEYEFRLRYNDGSYRWVRNIGHSIYDINGQFAGYIGAVFDISEHKSMMEELKKSKEEAESANKAKSQFLANMSHEIRTPLNGMMGMIDLTLMSALSDEQRDNLETAKSCVDSLLKLINEILDFSKIEAGKLELVNSSFRLEDLLEQTVKPYKIKASEHNVKVDYSISSLLPEYIVGDQLRIKQVLNNLISNALKFTLAGSINIKVNKTTIDDEEFILFEVSDTGVGIAEEDMDKLFKSFSQVDSSYTRKYNGTGLGLAISKKLITKMGGSIWIKSKKDVGSTFSFTLKFEQGVEQNIQQVKVFNKYKSSKELDILVVEDDKINQRVIEGMLHGFGHRVKIANNGFEAISYVSEKNFDLVFMDIQMPEMDGITTTKYIREKESKKDSYLNSNGINNRKNSRLPIIALTAHALQGDKEKFLSFGMDAYISKPIIISELFNTIEQIIKGEDDKELEDILGNLRKSEEPKENIDRSFLEDLVSKMKCALKDENSDLLEKYSHSVKEYIYGFNVDGIYENSLRIELSARKGKFPGIKDYIEKIEKSLAEL